MPNNSYKLYTLKYYIIYSTSTFRLPTNIFLSIDSIVRKFWSTENLNQSHYLAFVTNNKICLPIDYGGLGLRKFEDTMLAKVAWDILK